MRRDRPFLAALAMVAALGAGCSNGAGGKESTNAGSSGSTASASTVPASAGGSNDATLRDKAVKFSECMRDNGVSKFPDPTSAGDFAIGFDGSSLNPSSPVWKSALAACKDLEPPGALGEGNRSPAEMAAALKFAQCARDNGVKDFPDPTEHGPLIDTTQIPSMAGVDVRNDSAFNATMHTCLKVYDGAIGRR